MPHVSAIMIKVNRTTSVKSRVNNILFTQLISIAAVVNMFCPFTNWIFLFDSNLSFIYNHGSNIDKDIFSYIHLASIF